MSLDTFIPKLHRAELRTAKRLLEQFKSIPFFVDTNLLKIQLGEGELGDNDADIIEDALTLYVQWKLDIIKRDEAKAKKR
jgi:hypothetical protein